MLLFVPGGARGRGRRLPAEYRGRGVGRFAGLVAAGRGQNRGASRAAAGCCCCGKLVSVRRRWRSGQARSQPVTLQLDHFATKPVAE